MSPRWFENLSAMRSTFLVSSSTFLFKERHRAGSIPHPAGSIPHPAGSIPLFLHLTPCPLGFKITPQRGSLYWKCMHVIISSLAFEKYLTGYWGCQSKWPIISKQHLLYCGQPSIIIHPMVVAPFLWCLRLIDEEERIHHNDEAEPHLQPKNTSFT